MLRNLIRYHIPEARWRLKKLLNKLHALIQVAKN